MEEKETELQTALRELKEETNVEVKVIDGFRKQIEYEMPKVADTIKQCVYFLGMYIENEIICQVEEVVDASFLPYEKALELLTFIETKNILVNAQEFIESSNHSFRTRFPLRAFLLNEVINRIIFWLVLN